MCVYIHVSACACECACASMCVHMYARTCVAQVCISVNVCECIGVCMCVSMCACVCVCVSVCVCTMVLVPLPQGRFLKVKTDQRVRFSCLKPSVPTSTTPLSLLLQIALFTSQSSPTLQQTFQLTANPP